MIYALLWHSVRSAPYLSYFYFVYMMRRAMMIIDYVFSTIDPLVLAFLLGLTVGMFLELILILIIEKIGGQINE